MAGIVKPVAKMVNPLDPAGHKAVWMANLSAAHRRATGQVVQPAPRIPNWNKRK